MDVEAAIAEPLAVPDEWERTDLKDWPPRGELVISGGANDGRFVLEGDR